MKTGEASASAPMTHASFLIDRATSAVPASRPPPPSGVTIVSRPGQSENISSATVAGARDHVKMCVVVRRDVGQARSPRVAQRLGLGGVVARRFDDLGAERDHRVALDWGCAGRHVDTRGQPELLGGPGDCEAVVAGRSRHHAGGDLRSTSVGQETASAFAAPRSLKDPVVWTIFERFQPDLGAEVIDESHGERMIGVCHTNGAIRRAAASMLGDGDPAMSRAAS